MPARLPVGPGDEALRAASVPFAQAAAGDGDATAGTSVAAAGRGAARAGPRRAAATGRQRWRQVPYAIVLCGLVLALVWMRQSGQNVRGGTLAVAGILFAAALARLALPERRAGMLVVETPAG